MHFGRANGFSTWRPPIGKSFCPRSHKPWKPSRIACFKQQQTVQRTALKLLEAGEPELARRYLTYYSQTEAGTGLRLVEALADSLEARTKVLFGIRVPGDDDTSGPGLQRQSPGPVKP